MAVDYKRHKAAMGRRMQEASEVGRDIGIELKGGKIQKIKIAAPLNRARRLRCSKDLVKFMRAYFPAIFKHPFSDDQLDVIRISKRVVKTGGLFAEALPIASGKTSIVLVTAMWALMCVHRSFCGLVGATGPRAEKQLLAAIARQLMVNDLLLQDFPAIVYPFRCLHGIGARAPGQLYQGEPTYIEFGKKKLVFPNVKGSRASGAVIQAVGLTGDVLGMIHTSATGAIMRPDIMLVDDPQTAKSAKSDTETSFRESIVNGDVVGRAGPDVQVAAFCCLTCKKIGDLADRLLDHELHPEWQGQRKQLVYAWSKRQDLWDEYARLRRIGLSMGDEGKAATKYYKKHRRAMDKGVKVAWKYRKRPGELSAIQNAYNLLIDHPDTFPSEYQNAPADATSMDRAPLESKDILMKVNVFPRGQVPEGYTLLTAGMDVRGSELHWMVKAFGDGFSSSTIDYNIVPLPRHKDGAEAMRALGLKEIVDRILLQDYLSESGRLHRVTRMGIDSGWVAREIYRFWRQSVHRARLLPTKGHGFKAYRIPSKIAERDYGSGWYVKETPQRDAVICHISVDEWKTHLDERLRTAPGGLGCMDLFGIEPQTDIMPRRDANHRELSDHFTAEKPFKDTTRHGDEYIRWEQSPRPNHFWDCAVICEVMASIEGAKIAGVDPKLMGQRKAPRGKRVGTSKRGGGTRPRSRYG